MNARDQLLAEIQGFLDRTGIPETSFGKIVVNDGHLVGQLRAGRDLRLSTVERVRQFIADYESDRREERKIEELSAGR